MPFPLPFLPKQNYNMGGLRFGANRRNGERKHAGCDLIAPKGTPIYAVADGYIVDEPRSFYHGCWAMAVHHGAFIVRYCEFVKPTDKEMEALSMGSKVTAGQVIAHVGKMFKDSMLHFEVYAGTATGPFTDRKNKPFERRSDLLNPSDLLDRLRGQVLQSNHPVTLSYSLGVRR